ncbi:complex I subunit 5 family protein [Halobaculum gomorrense]|uniref:Multicomponent Na+:H+ antiporter subunit D n=1 Tax=Halobaculum gomorrense TaxID=43928 RepID=A0A1M5P880_9EURY|nr:proton-conducting transporter membrane subunit [Halobaculum gomorrense]SHG98006.1 multicomponent Na+:H+ antiporter subunit D [Halobaculum gomorrense]
MTGQIVIAPMLVALSTAILALLARFDGRVEKAVSLVGAGGYAVAVAALFDAVVLAPGGPTTLTYGVSDWQAPFGIVLVADALSAFMLALAAPVVVAAAVYSVVSVDERGQRLSYHPLFHFMVLGVSGAFLTGDVFNLFVWFEVMLMSSYVLVLFYSGREHTRAALGYVVLNLLASALMLVAIGGLYATTGTLNMADMARRLADPAAYGVAVAPTLGLGALLLSVFAVKAGTVPFHFWVPSAYRAAPAPVTAVLAGVVKKVGVYAVIRLFFTVFGGAAYASTSTFAYVGPVLMLLAGASIILGGVGAAGREDVDGLLAFSSIGQVGFIVLPLGAAMTVPAATTTLAGAETMLAVLGVTAALVYSLTHALAKPLLFLASGTIRSALGTTDFAQLGGLARRTPLLAGGFLLGSLALVGVPPILGFFGKLLVFRTVAEGIAAGMPAGALAAATMLVGAILTIAYVTRGWNQVFWGEPTERVQQLIPVRWGRSRFAGDGDAGSSSIAPDGGPSTVTDRALVVQVAVVVALALGLVGLGVGAEVVVDAATDAAHAATGTDAYVEAVAPVDPGAEYSPSHAAGAANASDGSHSLDASAAVDGGER